MFTRSVQVDGTCPSCVIVTIVNLSLIKHDGVDCRFPFWGWRLRPRYQHKMVSGLRYVYARPRFSTIHVGNVQPRCAVCCPDCLLDRERVCFKTTGISVRFSHFWYWHRFIQFDLKIEIIASFTSGQNISSMIWGDIFMSCVKREFAPRMSICFCF